MTTTGPPALLATIQEAAELLANDSQRATAHRHRERSNAGAHGRDPTGGGRGMSAHEEGPPAGPSKHYASDSSSNSQYTWAGIRRWFS
jgi:hypothetical protein